MAVGGIIILGFAKCEQTYQEEQSTIFNAASLIYT
jgi:hypothetical protein